MCTQIWVLMFEQTLKICSFPAASEAELNHFQKNSVLTQSSFAIAAEGSVVLDDLCFLSEL